MIKLLKKFFHWLQNLFSHKVESVSDKNNAFVINTQSTQRKQKNVYTVINKVPLPQGRPQSRRKPGKCLNGRHK